jgi:hypothetical protein
MPNLNKKDEQKLSAAGQIMARYHIAMSVLAQGKNSPYMTEEFEQKLTEAEEKLVPYTVAACAQKTK